MPEWLWREVRMWDLIDALARHRAASTVAPPDVPAEWLDELQRHLAWRDSWSGQHDVGAAPASSNANSLRDNS